MSSIAAAAAKELATEGLAGIYRHLGAGVAKFNVSRAGEHYTPIGCVNIVLQR